MEIESSAIYQSFGDDGFDPTKATNEELRARIEHLMRVLKMLETVGKPLPGLPINDTDESH